MKKLLILFLALILLLGGLFLYRGGHHALFLADALEEWLDSDSADQSLTVQVQIPGAGVTDDDALTPEIRQLTLSADTWWVEYADRPLFGLSTQGISAWTDGKNLYTDTGKSYALPEPTSLKQSGKRLALGLLLRGRVTKTGDTYSVTMDSDGLELSARIRADETLRDARITALLPDHTSVIVSVTPKPVGAHPIPDAVLDAMVRAAMEPPIPITEPLNTLIPALKNLLPMEGSLTLGVDCGILNLSETVLLRMDETGAELERNGTAMALALPGGITQAEPAALALLLLRNGTYTREGESTVFRIDLSAEATAQLSAALLPQTANLGIRFGQSQATLVIRNDALSCITLTANGEVPFLITTIPLAFQAELTIS